MARAASRLRFMSATAPRHAGRHRRGRRKPCRTDRPCLADRQRACRLVPNRARSGRRTVRFLNPEASREDARRLVASLARDSEIRKVRLIAKEDSARRLAADQDFAALLAALPENPLPDTLVVLPRDPSPARSLALAARLGRMNGVAQRFVTRATGRIGWRPCSPGSPRPAGRFPPRSRSVSA